MKSKQYCSVCKQWLDMEVVPTGDEDDDDGVIWFRCPSCQGFLPKVSGADLQEDEGPPEATDVAASGDGNETAAPDQEGAAVDADDDLPWDSPADMIAARERDGTADGEASVFLPEDEAGTDDGDAALDPGDRATAGKRAAGDDSGPPEPSEPIPEYAAMLAAVDADSATPYRPWETYEVGQCIHHLAWEDCGVVVAKEDLPGGRKVIKCYFEDAGVVRLIEQAPR